MAVMKPFSPKVLDDLAQLFFEELDPESPDLLMSEQLRGRGIDLFLVYRFMFI